MSIALPATPRNPTKMRSPMNLRSTPGIDDHIDQRQVPERFNSGRMNDCARLLHGGSLSVRLSPQVWSPLVYHEQRRSRRFNFQQLSGHPPATSFTPMRRDYTPVMSRVRSSIFPSSVA